MGGQAQDAAVEHIDSVDEEHVTALKTVQKVDADFASLAPPAAGKGDVSCAASGDGQRVGLEVHQHTLGELAVGDDEGFSSH